MPGDKARRIAISMDASRCIHAKSPWASCSSCAPACPSRAITLPAPSEPPVFDPKRCFGCGTCLASCEHDAFSSESFDEDKVVANLKGAGTVRLRCLVPYGEIDSLSSAMTSYRLSTCLAALSPYVLFSLAWDRTVVLAMGHCADCRLHESTGATLVRNIDRARALLDEWGRAENLVVSTAPKRMAQARRVPLDPDVEALIDSAPALNPSIKLKAHRLFNRSTSNGNSAPQADEAYARTVEQRETSWRSRLETLWGALPGKPSGTSYLWPSQKVGPARCSACGMCGQLCPTGSIRQRFQEGSFRYLFKPGSCVDCGLCFAVCPMHAISHGQAHNDGPFTEALCYTGPASACPRCGSAVLEGRAIGGYCRNCAIELGLLGDYTR